MVTNEPHEFIYYGSRSNSLTKMVYRRGRRKQRGKKEEREMC